MGPMCLYLTPSRPRGDGEGYIVRCRDPILAFWGHDQERPGPHGPAAGWRTILSYAASRQIVVKPTKHRACHELDRGTPGRRRSRP